jgi:beta-galactosidase GanA
MRGWYKYMFDNSADADFVFAEELDSAHIGNYKLLVLPFPLFMSDKTAKNLTKYVENGGMLVSEATPGRIDGLGIARRGMMTMREVFGVTHKTLQMASEPAHGHRFTPHPRTWGEYLEPAEFTGTGIFEGHTLPANLYIQCFDINGANQILTYNNMAAGAVNSWGEGKAAIIGSYIGHSAAAYKNDASDNFVKKLLSLAGIDAFENDGVNIRRRSADGKIAQFIFNKTDKTKKISFPSGGKSKYIDSYGGKITENGGILEIECEALDMAVVIFA